MSVSFPDIWAVPVYNPTVFTFPATHIQWVRIQATLWRLDAARNQWIITSKGPWIAAKVPDVSMASGDPSNYSFFEWNGIGWQSGASGQTDFFNLASGSYIVSTEYYWYADDLVPQSGSDIMFTSSYITNYGYGNSQAASCSF